MAANTHNHDDPFRPVKEQFEVVSTAMRKEADDLREQNLNLSRALQRKDELISTLESRNERLNQVVQQQRMDLQRLRTEQRPEAGSAEGVLIQPPPKVHKAPSLSLTSEQKKRKDYVEAQGKSAPLKRLREAEKGWVDMADSVADNNENQALALSSMRPWRSKMPVVHLQHVPWELSPISFEKKILGPGDQIDFDNPNEEQDVNNKHQHDGEATHPEVQPSHDATDNGRRESNPRIHKRREGRIQDTCSSSSDLRRRSSANSMISRRSSNSKRSLPPNDPDHESYRRKSICLYCWSTSKFCDFSSGRCQSCRLDNIKCIRKWCRLGLSCRNPKCPCVHPGQWEDKDWTVEDGDMPFKTGFREARGDYYRP